MGDCACKNEIAAKLMTERTRRDLVLMNTSVGKRQNGRQDICQNIMAVLASFGLPTFDRSITLGTANRLTVPQTIGS